MSEENGRTDLTWRELLDEGGARLSEAGVPDAGTDAWYLMEAAFGIDRVHYYLDQNRPIHAERLEKGLWALSGNASETGRAHSTAADSGNAGFYGNDIFCR